MAEKFGKAHRNVVAAIEALEIPEDFMSANFSALIIERPMPRGGVRTDKAYEMTRDGFSLLVMGFTGKKAMDWKIRFLEAFNAMEQELRHRAEERLRFQAEQARLETEKVKRLHTPAGTPAGFMTTRELLEKNQLQHDVKPEQMGLWLSKRATLRAGGWTLWVSIILGCPVC